MRSLLLRVLLFVIACGAIANAQSNRPPTPTITVVSGNNQSVALVLENGRLVAHFKPVMISWSPCPAASSPCGSAGINMTPLANVMTVEMTAASNVAYNGQIHAGPAFGQIGGVIGVGTAGVQITPINIYDAPGSARLDIYNSSVYVTTVYLTALPLYVPPTPTPTPYTIREVSDGSIQKGEARKFGPLSVRLYQGTTPVAGVAVHVACGSPAVTCAFPPAGAGTTELTSGPNGDLLLSYVVVSASSTSVSVLFSNSNLKSTMLTLGGGSR